MLQQGLAEFVERVRERAGPRRRRRAGRADPAGPRRGPDPVRRGRGERGRRGAAPGREAGGPAVGPRARRRLPLRRRDPPGGGVASSRPPGASSRSPTPSSGCSSTASGSATRSCGAGGSTPGKKDPLLDCNRLVLETIESRNDGKVDEASTIEGNVVIEAGGEVVSSRIRGPGDHRRAHPRREQLHRPVHVRRGRLRGRRLRARPLGRARGQPHPRASTSSPTRSSAGRSRSCAPTAVPARCASCSATIRRWSCELDGSRWQPSPNPTSSPTSRSSSRDPRRRARLLHRDLPARVVPARARDDPGQPGRPRRRLGRRAALPPAPGRLLVRAVRAVPGRAARPARRLADRRRDAHASTSAPATTARTTTAACSSRRGSRTASPR